MKVHTSGIITIMPSNPLFVFDDGMIQSPRAGFHIKNTCPDPYKHVIMECIDRKWLQPVAYMRDHEVIMETLRNS
jgi:hypothetical protein